MPFLVSVVLVVVGLFIRLRIMESPVFKQAKETGTASTQPMVEARQDPRNVLLAMGMRFAENSTFYIRTVFVLTYGDEHARLRQDHLLRACHRRGCRAGHHPVLRRACDRVGRRPVYSGLVFSLLFASRSSGRGHGCPC